MSTERTRWTPLAPGGLDPAQRALYDAIASGPRAAQSSVPLLGPAGELLGPFGLMTIAPEVGRAVQEVGAAIRFRASLTPVAREASILLVAVHRACDFEWAAHETAATEAGLSRTQLDVLASGEVPDGLDPPDLAALHTTRELLIHHTLDDDGYQVAVAELGEQRLAELVWLVGYYSMLALALATFAPATFAPDSFAPATVAPDSFAPATVAPDRQEDLQG